MDDHSVVIETISSLELRWIGFSMVSRSSLHACVHAFRTYTRQRERDVATLSRFFALIDLTLGILMPHPNNISSHATQDTQKDLRVHIVQCLWSTVGFQ